MIELSATFQRRMLREFRRAVGSEGRLVFFSGKLPMSPDDPAEGERVQSREVSDDELERLADGHEPDLPEGAACWRLLDNGGLVLMQGDTIEGSVRDGIADA